MRPELRFAHLCRQTQLIQHSPSNAHAYRLLVFKEHRSTPLATDTKNVQALNPATSCRQLLSAEPVIMTCFLKCRQICPQFFTTLSSQIATNFGQHHLSAKTATIARFWRKVQVRGVITSSGSAVVRRLGNLALSL